MPPAAAQAISKPHRIEIFIAGTQSIQPEERARVVRCVGIAIRQHKDLAKDGLANTVRNGSKRIDGWIRRRSFDEASIGSTAFPAICSISSAKSRWNRLR